MGYLLDTCALSELRKPNCNAGVATWIAGIQPDEVFLSVLTIGGIRRGIELHRRKSPTAAGEFGGGSSCIAARARQRRVDWSAGWAG